jgi:hypothetical protein
MYQFAGRFSEPHGYLSELLNLQNEEIENAAGCDSFRWIVAVHNRAMRATHVLSKA